MSPPPTGTATSPRSATDTANHQRRSTAAEGRCAGSAPTTSIRTVMLLLFLPALLYRESLTTPLQEIRRNLRGVALTSTLLVVATAGAVAAVARGLGLPRPSAWVLGAALAPTDATVGALARVLPRRNTTVIRSESLVNAVTALVVYGVAVGIPLESRSGAPPRLPARWCCPTSAGPSPGCSLPRSWSACGGCSTTRSRTADAGHLDAGDVPAQRCPIRPTGDLSPPRPGDPIQRRGITQRGRTGELGAPTG